MKLLILIAALVVIPTISLSQSVCNDRTIVLEHLSEKYQESPVGMGLASNGAILEVLSSKEGQSWTIIATQPNGVSCVLAAGESWQPIEYVEMKPLKPES